LQVIDTNADFTPLYGSDISSMQAAVFRQLFLAPAIEQAKQAQVQ